MGVAACQSRYIGAMSAGVPLLYFIFLAQEDLKPKSTSLIVNFPSSLNSTVHSCWVLGYSSCDCLFHQRTVECEFRCTLGKALSRIRFIQTNKVLIGP